MTIPVLAVDGDIIAYRTAAVCEDHFEGSCADIIDGTLVQIAGDSGVNDMRVYLSGPNNYRRFIASTMTYKGNRDTMVRPRHLDYCKEYLAAKYKAVKVNGYEADDCIATDMTVTGAAHCGMDKDIYQVAGRHFNYVDGVWQSIDADEAKVIFYRQVLMGDASDNVPGLPGVGVKRAADFVSNAGTAFADCLAAYREVCGKKLPGVDAEAYFIEQYALIAMHRNVPLSYDNTIHVRPWGLGR